MAKKIRPSLKDYLKTGEVRAVSDPERKSAPALRNDVFLDLLSPSDLKMWKSILGAGTAIQVLRLDVSSMREDFQTMDASRFTCYKLAERGGPLSPIRAISQIQPPLLLLLKWDETGVLTVYDPNV